MKFKKLHQRNAWFLIVVLVAAGGVSTASADESNGGESSEGPDTSGEPIGEDDCSADVCPSSVIEPDDRDPVSNTESFPWSGVVKYYYERAGGVGTWCTGSMIDDYHVLTAGHCVYNEDDDAFNSAFVALPGMDDGWDAGNYDNRPLYMSEFGAAQVTEFRVHDDWESTQDNDHDIGLLTLDRPVGQHTGAFDMTSLSQSHSWWDGFINIAGYPQDLDNGRIMYFDADDGCGADADTFDHSVDTEGGQSGSPAWVYDGTDRFLIGVHTHGTINDPPTACDNGGVRLHSTHVDVIQDWIALDSAPGHRPDLDERVGRDGTPSSPDQDFSDFTESVVRPGSSTMTAYVDVQNSGTIASGTFDVDFYLSTNTVISTLDRTLGSAFTHSIAPHSHGLSAWTGTVPSSIPDGTYYVGGIIDADDDAPEYDESTTSNHGYKHGKQLLVDGTPPSVSLSISPPLAGVGALGYDVDWSTSDSGSGLHQNIVIRENHNGVFSDSAWSRVCTQPISGSFDSGSCHREPLLPGEYCYRALVEDVAGNQKTSSIDCIDILGGV